MRYISPPVVLALATLLFQLSVLLPAEAASVPATGSLITPRVDHTASLLPNGKVLVAGGTANSNFANVFISSAELYNPATGTWQATGAMNTSRAYHTATLLPDGRVLVAGGWDSTTSTNELTSAELYDVTTGTWTETGAMTFGRATHTARQ